MTESHHPSLASESNPSRQPQKCGQRHIEAAQQELAQFQNEWEPGTPAEPFDWHTILNSLSLDSPATHDLLQDKIAGLADEATKNAFAETGFVIYWAMRRALDPNEKIESKGWPFGDREDQ